MTHLHFVGDGPRDAATMPHLVSRILGAEIKSTAANWARLHSAGTGYRRKLLYAVTQAQTQKAKGIVAVVDRDNAVTGSRLGQLQDARSPTGRAEISFR